MTGATISVDTTQMRRLSVDLGRLSVEVVPKVEAVLKKGAQNIKDAYTEQASSSPHFKGMAGSFSYDRTGFASSLGYKIGPDKGRRGGALGNIFFFGTSRGGGSGDLLGPLVQEEGNVAREMAAIVRGVL